jgi:hypothetical protein
MRLSGKGLLWLFGFILLQWLLAGGAFSFQDVPSGHWASGSVVYLESKGVFKDLSGNQFKGSDKVSRYEFALWLDRVAAALSKEQAVAEKLWHELSSELAELKEEIKELKTLTK